MITAFYAAILALLMMWLVLQVVKARRKNKIKYADGDVEELKIARSAHSNAVDNIPIALILLFMLEYNGAPIWLIHIIGILFVIGRVLHCRSILKDELRGRVRGMQITMWTIITLAILNLVFLPYGKLFLIT